MDSKRTKLPFLAFLVLLALFLPQPLQGYDGEYSRAERRLDERLVMENKAYGYEKSGDFLRAINIFEKIVQKYGNSAASSPDRNALIRLYEKTGQYLKALEQVEWFLKGNQNAQGRQASLADKQRLLQKMEAQKQMTAAEVLKGKDR